MTKYRLVTFETHEQDRSLHNYIKKFTNLNNIARNNYENKLMAAHRIIKISTVSNECDESNAARLTPCINDFIKNKLGCNLPWLDIGENGIYLGHLFLSH